MSLESIVFSSKHFDGTDEKKPEKPSDESQAAWIDPDDLIMVINPKLKNMPESNENPREEQISKVLQDQFNQTVSHIDVEWAKSSKLNEVVDASDIFSDVKNRIPPDSLSISRVADLFVQNERKASILQVSFNPAEPTASVLDSKGCIHIVSVNGKNNKVQYTLPFPNEKPRYCQCYTANGEYIIVGGKQGTFLTVDCRTQQAIVTRIPDEFGDIIRVFCSPDNKILAMISKKSVHFYDVSNRDLLRTIPTSDELRCGAFTDDSLFFIAAGKNGRGLLFECENFKAINRFQEPEMQYIHAISVSSSRVAIGTDAGVLHIFDFDELRKPYPKPIFSKMNLVTKVDSIQFNPTGELVVFASSDKKDSLKVLHLGSQKVFSNWPTQNTPLSYVRDIAFDSASRYLAIGNEKGRVTLWELSFYAK